MAARKRHWAGVRGQPRAPVGGARIVRTAVGGSGSDRARGSRQAAHVEDVRLTTLQIVNQHAVMVGVRDVDE